PVMRHVLTHRRLRIQPWRLHLAALDRAAPAARAGVWYRTGDAPPGGMVKPVLDLLECLAPEAQAV
ncbi:MAG: hypothetical protein WBC62_08415, partial [Candidatus Macondimonas sp.]